MKFVMFLMSLHLLGYSQQIEMREKCQCQDLLTSYDCLQLGSCEWDSLNMKCNLTTKLYTTRYILENTRVTSNSYSFYCEMFDEISCPSQDSCAWFKNTCTFFTGCTAYLRSTHEECQALSNRCISDGYQCVQISDCYTYKNSYSCSKNKLGQFCYWNNYQCEFPNSCSKLPLTFTTHDECNSQLDFCTVQQGGGCISMGYQCSDQKTQASCVTNINKTKQCFWANDQCQEVICENALQTLQTDEQCRQFLSECTTKEGGGCVKRKECSEALVKEACITNQWNEKCVWNGTSCGAAICQNAPDTYITNSQCKLIHFICISNGKGCVANYACGLAKQEQFCERDGYGNECFWNSVNCVIKTCALANEKYQGNEACTNFMSTCTGKPDGTGGCIEKSCSNAPNTITSNEDCEKYFPKNNCALKQGGGCQINSICTNIDFEEGCTKDIYGSLCSWSHSESKCYRILFCVSIKNQKDCVVDQFGDSCSWINDKCINKSCQTAPLTLKNEQQCQEYFVPKDGTQCTTIKGGGCRVKTMCEDADIQEACTTDSTGNECFWDEIENSCRLKQCSDIHEYTFDACQKVNSLCTLGYNGKCDFMQNCNQITNKYQCTKGKDGPCLWNNQYGACFQYDSCRSMKWKSDSECKMISPYCTTNGTHCVPITRCSDTNTDGGCVTGIEGECIQSVPALGSQEQKQCSKFYNCSDAFYLTHLECQQASKYCTTNSKTGCRDLVACNYYELDNCYINNIGVVLDDGLIISTGKCKWDTKIQQCRDENCEDFEYLTSSQCSLQLSSCTSNGVKCITKQLCSLYDQQLCDIASGIEGACYWLEGICRPLTCEAIQNVIDQNSCQKVANCIFDGSKCITKQKCAIYTTRTACSSDGTDGICVWSDKQEQCSLMINCQSASYDINACKKANDRCFWHSQDSQCSEHTCETFFQQVGDCQYFPTWDQKILNICKMKFGKCQLFDITTTKENECFNFSLQIYRWNPISNKCSECPTISSIQALEKNIGSIDSSLPPITNYSQTRMILIFYILIFIL